MREAEEKELEYLPWIYLLPHLFSLSLYFIQAKIIYIKKY